MEDGLLLIARLVLAAVFVVAGVAKLLDRPGSRKAMLDFGVPASLATPAALALPVAEILVAVLLLPVDTARYAAIGALILLLAFIGGIAYNLSKGRTPDCHCFGQLHSEPAGVSTLARNGALALVAALLLGFGWGDSGTSLVGWLEDLSVGETIALVLGVLAVAAAAVEGWLLVHLLSQNGRLLIRIDSLEEAITSGAGAAAPAAQVPAAAPVLGLPVGTPAPAFSLTGLYGETMTLDALRAQGKPVMLISSDPGCGPCNAMLPDIGRWQREYAGKLTISLISRGGADANRAKVTEHGITNVLIQKDREVAQLYEANGTPTAWIVQADGKIGSPLAPGADAIRALVARTVGVPAPQAPAVPQPAAQPSGNGNGAAAPRPAPAPAPAPAGAVAVGDVAPEVKLPDLDGNEVSLDAFKGEDTLMVFWNPTCGFCKRMTEDIKAWEANPPANAPKMLLVSTGTPESNREMGLSSTTLLDQGFTTGRKFGASGTPSGILIDRFGKVASGVAVGAPGVLALARGEDPASVAPPPSAAPPTPRIGQPAPAIKLKNLDGQDVSLAASRGTKTLVLFWNPGCGFCNRMLDDLKAWEAKPPKGAPKLMVISTGSVDDNKAQGLRSPVLMDQGFSVGSAFGASGTPSAVLVDAKGNIASDIAVGAVAVMELANGGKAETPKTVSV